jgi:hypothetical protein
MNTFTLDTTEALKLEFWQLDNEFNVRQEAQDKARKQQEALIASGSLSESVAAASIITDAIGGVVLGLEAYINDTLNIVKKGQPSKSQKACEVLNHFTGKDLNNIAADSISICLNGVGITPENTLVHALGEHVEHEFMLRAYREQDKKALKYLSESLKAQGGTTKQRYKSVEYSLAANRLEWEPWDNVEVILLGQIVFQQVVKHSGIFDLQPIFEIS